MKKIAFFDTKSYDRESFDRENNGRYDIRYFETRLTAAALPLADGCDAACAFVNAEIDRSVVEGLVKRQPATPLIEPSMGYDPMETARPPSARSPAISSSSS